MTNKYGEPWPSKNTISASASTVDQFVSTKPVTITWQEYERARACVNACAGVAEMGSVRELIDTLTDAREVVRDRLHMAEAAGNKKDIKWASEILADAEAALVKFKLKEDHGQTH